MRPPRRAPRKSFLFERTFPLGKVCSHFAMRYSRLRCARSLAIRHGDERLVLHARAQRCDAGAIHLLRLRMHGELRDNLLVHVSHQVAVALGNAYIPGLSLGWKALDVRRRRERSAVHARDELVSRVESGRGPYVLFGGGHRGREND